MTILLAVALVFDLPAALQRAIPDYTASLQQQISTGTEIREQLNLGGIVNAQNAQLSNCSDGAAQLESCGTAPDLKGITGWLNTPGNKPIDLKSLRGKVVLIDFWAYSCINCQRAIPTSSVGIRPTKTVVWRSSACTPRVRFREGPGQRRQRRGQSGHQLSDCARQQLRHLDQLPESLLARRVSDRRYRDGAAHQVRRRRLQRHRDVGQAVAQRCQARRQTPPAQQHHHARPYPAGRTYSRDVLRVGKVVNYGGGGAYDEGSAVFDYPPSLAANSFALRGRWALDYQGATSDGNDAAIKLNYHAKDVYIVVGGTGTLTVVRDGKPATLPISGPPTTHQVVAGDRLASETLEVRPSKGLQVFPSPTDEYPSKTRTAPKKSCRG